MKLPTIAITAGDINGVGYEVIIKTLANPHIYEVCKPVVYGNKKIMQQHLQMLQSEDIHLGNVQVIDCYPDDTPLRLGESTKEAGAASFAALERACQDIKNGLADALVTAPINKENIQSDKFTFTGHTEYLASVFGGEAVMMMVSDVMRVALVCNHTPIAKVPSMITQERILHKLRVLNTTLQTDFLIRKPRIAVLALNPHAGDNGLVGEEERNIIKPAIHQANEENILAFGPFSADGFFGAGEYIHYDVVLAMYHDEGLIPFKTLDMSGVNFTAGMPVVRTSPDHGTAYNLAGKNVADQQSFAHALFAAIDIMRNRALSKEINQDPLVVEQ